MRAHTGFLKSTKEMKDKYTLSTVKVPENYHDMNPEERKDVCIKLLETVYELIIKSTSDNHSKLELIYKVLDSTLLHHETLEDYEICSLISDTRKILDEQKNR